MHRFVNMVRLFKQTNIFFKNGTKYIKPEKCLYLFMVHILKYGTRIYFHTLSVRIILSLII